MESVRPSSVVLIDLPMHEILTPLRQRRRPMFLSMRSALLWTTSYARSLMLVLRGCCRHLSLGAACQLLPCRGHGRLESCCGMTFLCSVMRAITDESFTPVQDGNPASSAPNSLSFILLHRFTDLHSRKPVRFRAMLRTMPDSQGIRSRWRDTWKRSNRSHTGSSVTGTQLLPPRSGRPNLWV